MLVFSARHSTGFLNLKTLDSTPALRLRGHFKQQNHQKNPPKQTKNPTHKKAQRCKNVALNRVKKDLCFPRPETQPRAGSLFDLSCERERQETAHLHRVECVCEWLQWAGQCTNDRPREYRGPTVCACLLPFCKLCGGDFLSHVL